MFLIFILLLVSCDNTSQGRKHGNNSSVRTEHFAPQKQKKESLQLKKN